MNLKDILIGEIKVTNALVREFVGRIQTRDQFVRFALLRHGLTKGFVPLLEVGTQKAVVAKEKSLARVLQQNLDDENGIVDGKFLPGASHATWREWYLGALGVKEDGQVSSPAVLRYNTTLEEFMNVGNLEDLAGAILFVEGQIPGEFGLIQKKRDVLFSEKFVDGLKDTDVQKQEKARARMYIDDHIKHDAKAHFPDLLRVMEGVKDQEGVIRGISKMSGVRQAFYKEISSDFSL